ncbi:MAG: PQQ-dependent sugar dehydrogenase [Panacagrimonas sp.]
MRLPPILSTQIVFGLVLAAWYFQPWSDVPVNSHQAQAASPDASLYVETAKDFQVEEAVTGLELPWDLAFLTDTDILVTEKVGRLQRIDLKTGQRAPIRGLPEVAVVGQGGLHAVTLHPAFAQNGLIYLSYAAQVGKGVYTTRLMRARLQGDALTGQTVLLSAVAETGVGHHFGGAVLFDPQGYLYLSVGDRGDRHDAQNLGRHNGKILRLKDDGSVPEDNPFRGVAGARPEIWSYGHRNPQGMGLDPATGQIWAVEHGPRGGDELNRILRGRNYGWPVITYGKEYVGGSIGEGTAKEGMEQPVHWYVPSIATAGMSYYGGGIFPQWKDSVFIAALKGQHLNRVQLSRDGRFVKEERLLHSRGLRMRSVKPSPRGEVWVVTDNGVILRLFEPAATRG